MTKPTVSIVMRTKDRAILLTRALQDVARQVFTDWELIVVNDGGDPKPVDDLLITHADALDGRARVIHNNQSQGMEQASNQALEQAKGQYICIHDDDDCWDPFFLQECVTYLKANPSHGGVATRIEIVLEKIVADKVIEIGREAAWPEINQFSLTELMTQNIAVPIGCMYPLNVIDDLGGFRGDLPVVGDWEFHLRLAVNYDVGFLDPGRPLAFWHQRRQQGGILGNSVFASNDKHRYFDLKVRDEYLRQYAKAHGIGALLFIASMSKKQRSETALGYARSKARQALDLVRAKQQAKSKNRK